MFNFFKKPTFSTPLFIIASLIALILLGFFSVFFKVNSLYSEFLDKQKNDKYYLKNLNETDPLITTVPDINKLLAGPIISQNDPSSGPETTPITIVIYSDFLCDFCQKQETILKTVVQRYPNKIKLIWKDYPENNQRSLSFQAALAGRCAMEQNKFWQYHDLLYQNNTKLNQDKFIELAKQLDLKEKKFKQCLAEKTPQQQIKNNMLEANALEITGIPFIYVNQQEIMGQISEKELIAIIEAELK
ncbi:DsbA family protein [Patescibacteria group bacterium]|nr:DsbA family protein [Patescibacteria group bacterium]MBU0879180.1 DsbA family protein [Patescibacteria group bacterium]MBU0880099.1 DsbA family protein [Patescibacteria group bacterium]MBU1783444.1 DsbA family protein [Patescibacteria group bacterium]MBU1991906.1 DsbA family protein [Patescibacteria group bacterium]